MVVVLLGVLLVILAHSSCDFQYLVPFVAVSVGSGFRLVVMVQCGLAQYATAQAILDSPSSAIVDRRVWTMNYETNHDPDEKNVKFVFWLSLFVDWTEEV